MLYARLGGAEAVSDTIRPCHLPEHPARRLRRAPRTIKSLVVAPSSTDTLAYSPEERTVSRRIAAGVVFAALAGFASTPLFAACDTTAPVLTGFNVGPPTIDTTTSSQDVTCSMTMTDDLSGVAFMTCQLAPPAGVVEKIPPYCIAFAPNSGTPRNGVWSCVITLPRYSPSGVWTIRQALAKDTVGNAIVYTASQLAALGYPSSLTVTSDPDTLPPVQTAISLSPGSLDVSSGPQNLTCNMTVTDNKSGVHLSVCAIFSPSTSQKLGCEAFAPSSGTIMNGVFSCSVTVPQYAEAGDWTSQGASEDFALNDPVNAGPPITSVAVTSANPDTEVPTLTSFDFNPKSVSDGTGLQQVVCTVVATDSLAGVDTAICRLTSPVNHASLSCTATAPSSGTRNNGTFQCSLSVPQYAAAGSGTWEVNLTDLAGNTTDYQPQVPVLTVACAAGDAETTCRFAADRQSLTWDPMAGATRYNVYRGPLTNFVDANADHIPDGGYGTCQNSRDANLTDTTFVDTDIPTVAQKGFFYLVDYKSGSAELGLGANGFGTARTESSPCP
jgi:hypothetical protein